MCLAFRQAIAAKGKAVARDGPLNREAPRSDCAGKKPHGSPSPSRLATAGALAETNKARPIFTGGRNSPPTDNERRISPKAPKMSRTNDEHFAKECSPDWPLGRTNTAFGRRQVSDSKTRFQDRTASPDPKTKVQEKSARPKRKTKHSRVEFHARTRARGYAFVCIKALRAWPGPPLTTAALGKWTCAKGFAIRRAFSWPGPSSGMTVRASAVRNRRCG